MHCLQLSEPRYWRVTDVMLNDPTLAYSLVLSLFHFFCCFVWGFLLFFSSSFLFLGVFFTSTKPLLLQSVEVLMKDSLCDPNLGICPCNAKKD